MAFRLNSSLGSWDLALGETFIGRSRACVICFLDGRLSRRHAQITVSAMEAFITDLGSTNGVLVNGRRISGPARLSDGDQIIIGPCLFTVETGSKPAPPSTTSRIVDRGAKPSTAVISTDAIEKKDGSSATPRRLSPAIAAAVSSEVVFNAHSGPPPVSPSSERFAPADYQSTGTDAIVARPQRETNGTTTIRPSDDVRIQTDPLIEAHELAETLPEDAHAEDLLAANKIPPTTVDVPAAPASGVPRRLRLLAGAFDALQTSVLALVVATPAAITGLAFALNRGGASIQDGLPVLVFDQARSPVSDLAWTLCSPQGLSQAFTLFEPLGLREPSAQTLFILALVLAGLIFLAVHLAATIAATILVGGPMWHRRLHLRIVADDRSTPSVGAIVLRWCLLLVLWPQAVWSCLHGRAGIHDRLSGCRLVVD